MECLKKYEINSGQLVNKGKSCFLMDSNTSAKRANIVAQYLQVQRKEFPINYLGCLALQYVINRGKSDSDQTSVGSYIFFVHLPTSKDDYSADGKYIRQFSLGQL